MNHSLSNQNHPGRRHLAGLLLILALTALDQWTKQLAVRSLSPDIHIELIPGVLEFTYIQNRGAAFGILQNARFFFLVITLAALLVIGYVLLRIPGSRRYQPLRLCLYLIAAGAVGNLIDRLALSYVRDFIYFSLIDFPVFNVADMYITCSTFVIMLLFLFYYREDDDFEFLNRKSRRHPS